jgi:vancomycin resistance protein YoaR
MPALAQNTIKSHRPTILALCSFAARSKTLQMKRALADAAVALPRLKEGRVEDYPFVLVESISPLLTSHASSEKPLIVGKIRNLRLACKQLHSRALAGDEVFSFWRQVGPPWRLRGFVTGREVRAGCIIPTTGGGLCQLSGSLFELAVALGFELTERHSHTTLPPDVLHDPRRDATVFWNYVDLRFRASFSVFIESYVTEDNLIVRLRGMKPHAVLPLRNQLVQLTQINRQAQAESCFTCSEVGCIRHQPAERMPQKETCGAREDVRNSR